MKAGEHQVRERAYYIWEGEGRVFGRAEEHWFRAEAECIAKAAEQSAAATLTVQPSAPAISDAPSPAKALKPRSARAAGAASRAVSAKAEDAGRFVEKAATKVASASKASLSKSSGAKSSDAKSSDAKASAPKASTAKTSAGKSATGTSKSAPRSSGASSIALH